MGINLHLRRRAIYIPVQLGVPSLTRYVKQIARALGADDIDKANEFLCSLESAPAPAELLTNEPIESGAAQAPSIRASVIARVLIDLKRNGWEVSVEDGRVYAQAPWWPTGGKGLSPDEIRETKERIRQSLLPRLEEQASRESVSRFITSVERPRRSANGMKSVASLIADGPALANAVQKLGAGAIKPYLQPASSEHGCDDFTGLRHADVYRYFRYFWSFPYETTPGRTLPFLIRDAGQPDHPVCGLLALASPVPKLEVRDAALGWTPSWLEAVVACLDCLQGPQDHLAELSDLLGENSRLNLALIFHDVAALLSLPPVSSAAELTRRARTLSNRALETRIRRAHCALAQGIEDELRTALLEVSTEGLGLQHEDVFDDPRSAVARLQAMIGGAREQWIESRDQSDGTSARSTADRTDRRELLFRKKRIDKLLKLSRAYLDLLASGGETNTSAQLRSVVLGSAEKWRPSHGVSGGKRVNRGVKTALAHRQNRLVASQVADVVVCGAVPPYRSLLGGKLAALLALSRDVAEAYHARYANMVSTISSEVAGRDIIRPADLVALTTTSFYAVGSSQYNRTALPAQLGGVRWRPVGTSVGHGTLHFSRDTTSLLQTLVRVETGTALNTGQFGEGPSERLRKIRDGLARLGLPANELLTHGMPRLVYLAELLPGRSRLGVKNAGRPWRATGPTAEEVATHWRERWLAPRIERDSGLVARLQGTRRDDLLLGRRAPSEEMQYELRIASRPLLRREFER